MREAVGFKTNSQTREKEETFVLKMKVLLLLLCINILRQCWLSLQTRQRANVSLLMFMGLFKSQDQMTAVSCFTAPFQIHLKVFNVSCDALSVYSAHLKHRGWPLAAHLNSEERTSPFWASFYWIGGPSLSFLCAGLHLLECSLSSVQINTDVSKYNHKEKL